MCKKNIQPCKNEECSNIVKYSTTGFCYQCSLAVRKLPNRKPIVKVKCYTDDCNNLVSSRSKIKYCNNCYKPEIKRPEKNITYLCPNRANNSECLKGRLVNKWTFIQLVKENRICKKCGHLKGVETRQTNGSYVVTEIVKQNISNGLKKSHEANNYVVWNKGLSAEIDERVAKMGKSRPGELNPMYGTSYKEIWKSEHSGEEFNDKFLYNSYLKSHSSLEFEDWCKLREENAYYEYKKEVWRYTIKNPIKTMPNYEKRGKAGVDGAYQLDHIISIKYGFEHNIDPRYIGSMDNLWFVPWEINLKKSNPKVFLDYLQEYYYYDEFGRTISQRLNHIMSIIWKVPLPKLIKIK